MDATIAKVVEKFVADGHRMASPPLLQPADLFLDLAGEDIRRRLYLTTGQDGTDLCLRPDFTIPVCRLHLETATSGLPVNYCYRGPVFRQRSDGLGEIDQIGAESFGRSDRLQADADMLRAAVNAVEAFGLSGFEVRVGDEAIFAAVLAGTGLPQVWQRRLKDLFGDTDKLTSAIDRMARTADQIDDSRDVRLGFLSALESAAPEAAHAVVEDLLSIAGISAVGGRTAGEIADRFLEQAALASGSSDHSQAAQQLKDFLSIQETGGDAVSALQAFETRTGINIESQIADFDARLKALEADGINKDRLYFSAEFGRRLDYYSGFVFEIYKRDKVDGQLVGGGRYDRLLKLLGAEADIPATGFSIWLDRIATALGAGS
ncbi:ATP phosphoribosyltransferase regulatory subunit [Roseibium hamelinense]|uniref:ATP phosphoribosyltransferase regulatory subunit n=1 Tax=Roseibium hamelinense TaxID=150831 RepID=A0A562T1K6_9HYPH|nr:ATP phosphoribosyltransferase regulatory subunit [Roseibium hamelinense]MTI43359.1 ATP phosphoribosyltransferase regulatory subunit [Roseibium hamelinense]TWI87559.1 ATP phosphoribosyltransferase regulatory subunit [Roseibium hamelinense]